MSENGLAIRVAWERVQQLPEANVSPAGLIYRVDVLDLLQGVADDEDRREPPSRDTEIERKVLNDVAWQHAGHDLRLQPDLALVCVQDGGTLIGDLASLRSQPASEPSLHVLAKEIAKDWNGRALDTAWAALLRVLPEGCEVALRYRPVVYGDDYSVEWRRGAGPIEVILGDSPEAPLFDLAARLSQPADNEAAE